MKIILFGAPGSGKGTQAELIKNTLNLYHISTGELIRKEIKENQEIKNIVKNGNLINDETIINIIEKNIKNKNNILFDGFPRTLNQAICLSKIKIDYIIKIDLNEKKLIKRLKYRITNKNKNYNIIEIKQKIKNKDNVSGEKFKKRNDDKLISIKKRFLDYENNTENILAWYKKKSTNIIKINGDDSINEIYEKIIKHIKFYEKNI